MGRHVLRFLVALAVFLLGVEGVAKETILIKGSSTMKPLIQSWKKSLSGQDYSIKIKGGGSGIGIKCANSMECDIGMSSKSVSNSEYPDLNLHHLGWDGLAFVVHKDNPIKELSKSQVIDIYTGKIKKWSELNSFDLDVIPFQRGVERGEQSFFQKIFGVTSSAKAIESNNAVVGTIYSNKGSISFMSAGKAQNSQSKIKVLKINHLGKDYSKALKRPLYIFYNKNHSKKSLLATIINDLEKDLKAHLDKSGMLGK